MNKHINTIIKSSTGAQSVDFSEEIQSLWSGYGSIVRYTLKGASHNTVIVKHVRLPKGNSHPRGWNTDYSHHRKIKSYEVETSWYSQYASMCDEKCRIPKIFAIDSINDEIVMVMEDLDKAGFALRLSSVTLDDMELCLRWLANFHATFMNTTPDQLWETGTYWHLDTRPDELNTLDDHQLKRAAKTIDQKLSSARFLTFVHGDAKLANFCFSNNRKEVSAVDFQYVGGGCGMKDVAYFIGSCLYEEDCEKYENQLLDIYFEHLKNALISKKSEVNFEELEEEWRMLFPIAWTDFHRFIKGWSPGHWKINSYSEKMAKQVIKNLNNLPGA